MPEREKNFYEHRDGRRDARYSKKRGISHRNRYSGAPDKKRRKTAREKIEEYTASLFSGRVLSAANSRHRFAFYCEEWLRLELDQVKDSTYIKYEGILRNHILPELGKCPLTEINTQLAEEFKKKLLGKNLSTKTVRDILAVLNSILKYTKEQCPEAFPAVDIRYPREPRREIRVLSVAEQRRLLVYLQKDMDCCKFGVLLAFFTGLRVGELCALRWKDISLQERTIHIGATMQRLRNLDGSGGAKTKVVISSPKSDASVRTIPLTESMVGLCQKYDPHCPEAFVLTGTEKYIEPRQMQKRFEKYTQECGLEGVHFHTIRHTFATRCVEVGFEIKSLSEILGHSNTTVTLGRYVHSSMELKRANMDKLTIVGP